jgi:hypothetical protein
MRQKDCLQLYQRIGQYREDEESNLRDLYNPHYYSTVTATPIAIEQDDATTTTTTTTTTNSSDRDTNTVNSTSDHHESTHIPIINATPVV